VTVELLQLICDFVLFREKSSCLFITKSVSKKHLPTISKYLPTTNISKDAKSLTLHSALLCRFLVLDSDGFYFASIDTSTWSARSSVAFVTPSSRFPPLPSNICPPQLLFCLLTRVYKFNSLHKDMTHSTAQKVHQSAQKITKTLVSRQKWQIEWSPEEYCLGRNNIL